MEENEKRPQELTQTMMQQVELAMESYKKQFNQDVAKVREDFHNQIQETNKTIDKMDKKFNKMSEQVQHNFNTLRE